MTDPKYQALGYGREAFEGRDYAVSKLAEDQYELYVNEDFIGYKTLYHQLDDLRDVDEFLKRQGIDDFSSKLEGDHYYIDANGENAERVKEVLEVYCQNR
ncbi:hypothetical protein LS684_02410 [Cytobacillus spongiae]|uniref:hypothetical protein n=1 Tax=Cytobacillus spongiae TaxID=2901381 RepID=UPI001F260685|nr:hypothetical protein [Cytobacillus spongiae]UII56359.1 hypothetical protein LS684_02410 [Cytobacillus spongiae]